MDIVKLKFIVMTNKEYQEYINTTYNKEGIHKTRHFVNDGTMTNANKTGDRDADKGFSWIAYWRAMTGINDEPLLCSSCGKEIFTGDIPAADVEKYKKNGDTSSHEAEGGHIWIQGTNECPGGRYITPLCPSCNAKRGQQIPVKKNSKVFKELGAKIVDEN